MKKVKEYTCTVCGESNSINFYGDQKIKCKRCRNLEQTNRIRDYKKESVNYLGGNCVICGYNKSTAALQFHHKDMSEKDPSYSSMRNWSFDRKKTELDKCILVCANCHAEIHAGLHPYIGFMRISAVALKQGVG